MLPAASPTKFRKSHSFADEADDLQKDLHKKHPVPKIGTGQTPA